MTFHNIAASILLFGTGLLPLIFYKGEEHRSHPAFKYVLSLAVGILIGDVFFHLLPEIWAIEAPLLDPNKVILFGIILFFTLDKLFGNVVGYLTISANTIDNFLHGLAISASFRVSLKAGWLTTAGILLHELPHELTDFTVLSQCGFSKFTASIAQVWTCLAGILGSLCEMYYGVEYNHLVISAPLTVGIFLYVSLTSLIPSLNTVRAKEILFQLLSFSFGLFLCFISS